MAHYLICYDIADRRRLGRVHRCIVRHAVFVQLSVYYLRGDRRALDALLDELRGLIDEKTDDVRVYAVEPLQNALQLGQSWLPEGILLPKTP